MNKARLNARENGLGTLLMVNLCCLLLLLCFVACNKNESSTTNLRIFRYNQPNPITSLDPAFARSQNNIWAVHHLFNGLVELDDSMRVAPSIAKYWRISEDGLTYRFIIRQDIFFHPSSAFKGGRGRKVSARDFVYSFGRLLDPQVHSPGSWIFKGKVRENNPFEAENDSVFVMHLANPFPPMLSMLTMQYCSVVPKEAIDYYQEQFRKNPVGTGPFVFKNWLEDQALVLLKNQNYFEKGIPTIDGVLVTFMGDRKTAYLEVQNGNLDILTGLESSFVNDLLTSDGELKEKHKEKFEFQKMPFLNTEYLGINLEFHEKENNPLLIKEVRQALNYGIDRQKMLTTLRNGVGIPASEGFIPKGLPSFNPKKVGGYQYNPDKAVQLLSKAGYNQTNQLPELEIYTNKDYLDLCTFIISNWEQIGVKSSIQVVESSTLRQMMAAGKIPFFRASWIADYPDGESFLTVFYSKNPAPPNYTHFKNFQFDSLYEKALLEKNDEQRHNYYRQMDSIIVEEAPVIFLFYDETAIFTPKKVKGFKPNSVNLLNLKEVYLHEGEANSFFPAENVK